MAVAIIVDWYGPYLKKNDLRDELKSWAPGTKTLYMGTSTDGTVNYVGMTSQPATRLNNHEKLADPVNTRFWGGEIVSQGVGGRRSSRQKVDHEIAEHALIAWLTPSLNKKLVSRDLADCVVLYSRFFDRKDGEKVVKGPPEFPAVIAYNSWAEVWDV